jgi:hypothetical protein
VIIVVEHQMERRFRRRLIAGTMTEAIQVSSLAMDDFLRDIATEAHKGMRPCQTIAVVYPVI